MIRTVKGELDEIDSFIDWKMTVDNNLLEHIKNKTILMLLSQGFLPLFNSESKRSKKKSLIVNSSLAKGNKTIIPKGPYALLLA